MASAGETHDDVVIDASSFGVWLRGVTSTLCRRIFATKPPGGNMSLVCVQLSADCGGGSILSDSIQPHDCDDGSLLSGEWQELLGRIAGQYRIEDVRRRRCHAAIEISVATYRSCLTSNAVMIFNEKCDSGGKMLSLVYRRRRRLSHDAGHAAAAAAAGGDDVALRISGIQELLNSGECRAPLTSALDAVMRSIKGYRHDRDVAVEQALSGIDALEIVAMWCDDQGVTQAACAGVVFALPSQAALPPYAIKVGVVRFFIAPDDVGGGKITGRCASPPPPRVFASVGMPMLRNYFDSLAGLPIDAHVPVGYCVGGFDDDAAAADGASHRRRLFGYAVGALVVAGVAYLVARRLW